MSVRDGLAGDVEVRAGTGEDCFIEEVFEAIILKFPSLIQNESSLRTKDLILLVIYRQPGNNNTDTFLNETEKWIKRLDKRGNEIIITGDMNLYLLKHEYHLPTASYLDIMISNKFFQE